VPDTGSGTSNTKNQFFFENLRSDTAMFGLIQWVLRVSQLGLIKEEGRRIIISQDNDSRYVLKGFEYFLYLISFLTNIPIYSQYYLLKQHWEVIFDHITYNYSQLLLLKKLASIETAG
jgi:hypothetical protein